MIHSEFPHSPAEPRHAATVMLLREQEGRIEVLLTRRHENLAFMGGRWVFPGGALSHADVSNPAQQLVADPGRIDCDRFVAVDGQPLPRSQCLGLVVAACRETFEETGVLLAQTRQGHDGGGEVLARMHGRRSAIVAQPELFATSLQEADLQLASARLVYWAHWITPSAVPKRFDTRFFLARLPPGQSASIDAVETTEMAWMTPAAFIAAARDGAMTLSQPTLYNLLELDASARQHGDLPAIFTDATHRSVTTVLPKISGGPQRMIVMPWDAEYHEFSGVGVSRDVRYPESLQALPPRVPLDR